jgi:Protein of unknown function (DUF2587)
MNPISSPAVVSLAERRAAKRGRVGFAGDDTLVPRRAPDPSRAEVLAALLDGEPAETPEGDRLSHELGQDWLNLLLSRPEMADLTQDERRIGPGDVAPGLHVAGDMCPAQTLRGSVSHLGQLAPHLIEELERITLPFNDHAPSDTELRIAQTQLDDWLERLSHGIQAELFALQMAAQQQLLNIADLAAASARCRATNNTGQDRGPSQGLDPGMPGPDLVGQSFSEHLNRTATRANQRLHPSARRNHAADR